MTQNKKVQPGMGREEEYKKSNRKDCGQKNETGAFLLTKQNRINARRNVWILQCSNYKFLNTIGLGP
jgi:hypothetical protein